MIKIVDGVEVTLTDAEKAEITQRQIDMLPIVKRMQRDALLAASDSMALADKITDEWRTYRQALRDLPATEGFPDVTFPTPPS